jgi:Cd2+/Zn2+-exporting ATPase
VAETDAPATTQNSTPTPWWPLALAGTAALAAEIADWLQAPAWLAALLALAAILGSGIGT